MSYSDFLGRELKEGDPIVIATRVGNSAETGRTAEVCLKNVLRVM